MQQQQELSSLLSYTVYAGGQKLQKTLLDLKIIMVHYHFYIGKNK